MARLPGETAPIVLTLFAWSRRVIAAFIPLSLIALIWGLAGLDVSGRRLSLDLNPVWQVGLIVACTLSVVVSLFLRRLARKIDSEVRLLGSIDALTGLLNRRGLSARLERPNIAVLYLDLDRFKAVNDGMGHDTGDDVLRAVADRIRAVLRPADAAARLGGDEFVVVVEDKDAEVQARALAERLRGNLARPIRSQRRDVTVSASIGVAVKSTDLAGAEDLLRAADMALYRAKRQGRNRVVVFNGKGESNVLHRLDLEKDLWQAMDRGELELHYLPEVSLRTGAITGVEALVRWRHPEHGLLRPESFILMAEETGSVRDIGLWVLEAAARDWAAWRRRLGNQPPPALSINVSPRQIGDQEIVRRAQEVMLATGMDPQFLKLEVAERPFLDALTVQRSRLEQLSHLGVRIIVDDFGSSDSPLSDLKELPVHGVKIDRSLVGNLEFDDSRLLVVQAIVALAHDLGLEVTAVGIETAAQLAQLHELGCDFGQGYYLSEPVAAAAVTRLLTRTLPARRGRTSRRAA
jgi:diguanylate cyclase (GGDEF)-like protein